MRAQLRDSADRADREANWNPTEAFKPAIKAAQADGALVIGQLTAGGRQVPENVQKHPISPSGGDAFDAIGYAAASA